MTKPISDQSAREDAGSLAELGEFGVIEQITSGFVQPDTTLLGPGDDAAIVRAADGRVVVSTDVFVEGVHFRTDWASAEQIGRRSALAAMSDIAAMGAVPTALVVGVSAPANTPVQLLTGLAAGVGAAATEAGAGVVGGDMTRSDQLTISVTVLGDLGGAAPILRSGARPGDILAFAGRLGWAAAGLAVLSRGFRSPAVAVNAYRVPEPPLSAGISAANAGATSMIDISDGLLADLGHISVASGVALDVRTMALDVHPRLREVGSALGKDALSWVLTGGEDHALAATFPAGTTLPDPWQVLGTVTVGSGVTVDGSVYEGPAGWDHYR